jgi:transcriptional antiterminator
MTDRRYIVERTLNNNVLIVRTDDGREQILVGRGLGFGVRPGASIHSDDERIEKRFTLVAEENQEKFRKLYLQVSPEVIGVSEEIIAAAVKGLGTSLHEHIHVALADHIGFALTRLQGGLEIENPFLEEIRTLYPKAWALAEAGAQLIEKRFQVVMPESEIGFLTLHLQAAAHRDGLSEAARVTDAVRVAVDVLERETGRPISKDSLDYARLVTHLRFAIQRVLKEECIVNPLASAIRERLPKSYAYAAAVTDALEERLKTTFPRDEVADLALHVARFIDERDSHDDVEL